MGYASPEGEFGYNKHLAERRTHTLSYHVLSKYPQLKKASIYEIEGSVKTGKPGKYYKYIFFGI